MKSIGDALERQVCVFCGGDATEFKDELSEREYYISALCQKCQNDVFANNPFADEEEEDVH